MIDFAAGFIAGGAICTGITIIITFMCFVKVERSNQDEINIGNRERHE